MKKKILLIASVCLLFYNLSFTPIRISANAEPGGVMYCSGYQQQCSAVPQCGGGSVDM